MLVDNMADGVWIIKGNGRSKSKVAEPVLDLEELKEQSNINFLQLAKDVRDDLATFLNRRGSAEMWGSLELDEAGMRYTHGTASDAALDILAFIVLSPEARRRELDRLGEVVELHESRFTEDNEMRTRAGKLVHKWYHPKTMAAQIRKHQDFADRYRKKFKECTGVEYKDETEE